MLSARLRDAIGGREHSEVARSAGIDRKALWALLTDQVKRGPFLDTVTALARVLDVRASWLAFGDGPREAAPDQPLDERLVA